MSAEKMMALLTLLDARGKTKTFEARQTRHQTAVRALGYLTFCTTAPSRGSRDTVCACLLGKAIAIAVVSFSRFYNLGRLRTTLNKKAVTFFVHMCIIHKTYLRENENVSKKYPNLP